MASGSIPLAWFLNLFSLSSYIMFVVCTTASASPHHYLNFSLTHRDAETSPLRSVEADPADLRPDMPLRSFVATGRALRARLNNTQRKPQGLFVGKFSYGGDLVGDFFLTLPVGTPSQNMIFLLDTGSEFPWTQCSPCLNCTNTPAPRFVYHHSSSFLTVPCDSYLCGNSVGLTLLTDVCKIKSAGPGRLCNFVVGYGDGSIESGFFSIDSFHLGPTLSNPFVFGCANIVRETVSSPSSGLLGLDAGPFSFTSQLFGGNPEMPKKFAYCLPDRIKSLNVAGRIEFGNYKQAAKARYTPLAPPYVPLGSSFYYVKLEGIAVGGTLIKVDMEAEGVKGGGTVFDSGSAVTCLVKPLYDEMVRAMKRQTAHLGPYVDDKSGALCYKASWNAKKLPKVPRISMHFAGGVELELGPGSILMPAGIVDNTSIGFCLAFLITPKANVNIIGNYQQQNYWVEYNLQTSSLGLAKADCANYYK